MKTPNKTTKGATYHLKRTKAYLRNRCREETTWAGAMGIVLACSVAPAPYSYLGIALGVIGILVPKKNKPEGCA